MVTVVESNPMYFKSVVMNVYQMVIASWGLGIVLYNIKHKRIAEKYVSKTALMITGMLSLPTIIDNLYDIMVSNDPHQFNITTLSLLLAAMSLAAIMSIAFAIYNGKQCYQISECLNGFQYTELIQKERGGDEEDAAEEEEAQYSADRDAEVKQMYPVNVFLLANYTTAVVTSNVIYVLNYLMRVWSSSDKAFVREMDVLFYSLCIVALIIAFVLLDFWQRDGYMGPLFSHYLTAGMFLLSISFELHDNVKVLETLTLISFLCVALPLCTFKIIYWIGKREEIEQRMKQE